MGFRYGNRGTWVVSRMRTADCGTEAAGSAKRLCNGTGSASGSERQPPIRWTRIWRAQACLPLEGCSGLVGPRSARRWPTTLAPASTAGKPEVGSLLRALLGQFYAHGTQLSHSVVVTRKRCLCA